jgi:hypothetical protein
VFLRRIAVQRSRICYVRTGISWPSANHGLVEGVRSVFVSQGGGLTCTSFAEDALNPSCYVLLLGSPISLASPLDSAGNTSTQTRKGRDRLERGGHLNNGAWDEALKSRRHLELRMFTDLVRVPTLTLFGWSIRGLPHISHLKSRANAVPILFYYQVPR